jgi:hypothetical protein
MNRFDQIGKVLLVGALAYLGLYGFGLVMGVYTPGEVPYFTIPAVLMAAGCTLHALLRRRALKRYGYDREAMREAQQRREERGF